MISMTLGSDESITTVGSFASALLVSIGRTSILFG